MFSNERQKGDGKGCGEKVGRARGNHNQNILYGKVYFFNKIKESF